MDDPTGAGSVYNQIVCVCVWRWHFSKHGGAVYLAARHRAARSVPLLSAPLVVLHTPSVTWRLLPFDLLIADGLRRVRRINLVVYSVCEGNFKCDWVGAGLCPPALKSKTGICPVSFHNWQIVPYAFSLPGMFFFS